MTSSLYIHIPFCSAKCSYCSFNSYAGLEGLQSRYVECLCAEMENVASSGGVESLKTVFLGGGTPSVLPGDLSGKIITTYRNCFSAMQDVEISMEINPGTVDMAKLDFLHVAGVNRISFGVQSFIDKELRSIGRIHTAEEAVVAVSMAGNAGYENVSLDLMYGLPGQTTASWHQSLETAISLGVKHLSLYQLTVEEGTPLQQMMYGGTIQLPGEDELAAMDNITRKLTDSAGLRQYEISNYAKTGYQCRHNITYWENNEYLGVGAGAVSCVRRSRKRNIADPVEYCDRIEAGKSVVIEEENLDIEASFRETVIMALRLNSGFSLPGLTERYGINALDYYGATLENLIRDGFVEQHAGMIALTDRGRGFANLVMSELV
ncbi:putative oxygen-independent coproporphyrinogen III oxidase [Desulfocapsa sulfexigens DSM 10523]|uniref:Heme chaperone HemW n=1 Tax=Desulfocapsa sulfexigens (strain DSM 10523 / SB164P1) TaxID=1167006 RepID=M1P7K8_DESSD|nr:radical SAM family heme chaperone HemW [Desulfocapsa sulfexigens]AGF77682.1 putative oxygen-independent coproporphyrinogen III oxidase [Desulfocapsa sulfexigens DSM 10523]